MKYTTILVVTLATLCGSKECLANDFTISQMMEQNIRYSSIMSYTDTQMVRDTNLLSNNQSIKKRKSAGTALFISVVPGFVVHGAGHFYVGKKRDAVLLFAGELASFGLLYAGAGGLVASSGESDEATTLYFLGVSLFISTWIYDLIGAPVAANKYNKTKK